MSSVLVKGMKMPDSCAVCRFAGRGGYFMERIVCMFTGKNEDAVKVDRLPDCPLIALPDKHGRLVDADALIEKYWDGNSMTITAWDLKDIKTVIEAEDGT